MTVLSIFPNGLNLEVRREGEESAGELVAESPAESIPQKVILEFHCCSRLPWSPFRPNFSSGRPKARVDCSHLSSWAVTFSAPPHVEPGGYFFLELFASSGLSKLADRDCGPRRITCPMRLLHFLDIFFVRSLSGKPVGPAGVPHSPCGSLLRVRVIHRPQQPEMRFQRCISPHASRSRRGSPRHRRERTPGGGGAAVARWRRRWRNNVWSSGGAAAGGPAPLARVEHSNLSTSGQRSTVTGEGWREGSGR